MKYMKNFVSFEGVTDIVMSTPLVHSIISTNDKGKEVDISGGDEELGDNEEFD